MNSLQIMYTPREIKQEIKGPVMYKRTHSLEPLTIMNDHSAETTVIQVAYRRVPLEQAQYPYVWVQEDMVDWFLDTYNLRPDNLGRFEDGELSGRRKSYG